MKVELSWCVCHDFIMDLLVGLLAVSVSIIGWGSYFVPMKRIKSYDPFYFQLLVCLTIFSSSVLVSLAFSSFVISYFGILSGFLWATGNILATQAVRYSGLSRTTPVWMGIIILSSFVWGTLFFKEPVNSLLLGTAGLLLLIAGIFFISRTNDSNEATSSKGIIFAIIAGLVFGTYLVPLKLSGLEPIPFLFPMSLGVLTGGLLIYLFKRPVIDIKIIAPGALAGVIWNTANIASFFGVKNLGIAIGLPLTQMALFVSVLWGLWYFKEIKKRESIQKLVLGAVILFAGAILLTLSR